MFVAKIVLESVQLDSMEEAMFVLNDMVKEISNETTIEKAGIYQTDYSVRDE